MPQEPLPVAVTPEKAHAPSTPTTRDDDAPPPPLHEAQAQAQAQAQALQTSQAAQAEQAARALAPLAGSLPRRAARLGAGTVVDHKYEIERVLGEGGMGVVYLARDVHTGLHVVLKAVRQEIAHRRDTRARTLAEGRALAHIDHPNVVRLNAVVEEQGSLWLVMQYIEGESLDRLIGRRAHEGRPLGVDETLRLFRQIAAGVGAAHGEGVIHRDLKPANVMVRAKDGVAKVTDFGIAKEEADAIAGRGMTRGIIGSLYYMSPEQVVGRRDLDKRVDIYALGVLLYEMLVGHVPFDADSDVEIMRKQLDAPLPRVSDERPEVPATVDAFLQRACAKDRAARFSSCDELIAALDALGYAVAPSPPTHAPTFTVATGATAARGGAGGPLATAATAATAATMATGAAVALEQAPSKTDATASTTAPEIHLPAPREARKPGWRRALAVLLAIVVLAAGAAGILVVGGLLPATDKAQPEPAVVPATPAPRSSVTAAPEAGRVSTTPTLATLEGAWTSNSRDFDAVMSGDVLEFRVHDAEQFTPQDYEAGEVRFSLRALPQEPEVFAVEDHLRFIPPVGLSFDAMRARGTCQDVRSSAEDRPLRARYDGSRLSVEFARIEPESTNFLVTGGKVVSCRGLGALKATRVLSVLTRP
ncbi:serine/threonine-protein kinase [Chondromyces apiculatus]|uniref:Protein kinase domain-containing protein n=1 Tax=Chondromyces apiculatus DSM 436 TaxID=1192034 RepID=A0A017T8C4_9BACT|nr:serine/threonine-protein kinase [Chondromyces apiculatus]EYF05227.1 Hypothetical protein CAP_3367 [Chondromyces apiculatus DSM 436]